MNERAFNLFTALLGFVLVILTTLLINSMMAAEDSATMLISDMEDQSRIEAVSRLARADAIQIVNYGIRSKMEEWFSKNTFEPSDPKTWEDWNAIVKSLERKFGQPSVAGTQRTQPFIHEVTQHLVGLFDSYSFAFEGYRVRVKNRENFEKILNPLLEKEISEEKLLEVIDCDGTPNGCPTGTLYINLNIADLSDEEYEQLPLLEIERLEGDKKIVVSDPLLPRNNLRFYVPLRIFKALAYARQFTHFEKGTGFNEATINTGLDYGFLSPRIHNEFDAMALGICDYGYCAPRENPLYPPKKRYIDNKGCPTTGRPGKNELQSVSIDFVTGNGRNLSSLSYNPASTGDLKEKLKRIAKARLCDIAEYTIGSLGQSDFEVEKYSGVIDGGTGNCPILNFEKIDVIPIDSKQVIDDQMTDSSKPSAASLSGITHAPIVNSFSSSNCPYDFALARNRRIGVFLEGSEVKFPELVSGKCSAMPETVTASRCAEITAIRLTLGFREKNESYKVIRSRDLVYRIGITTNRLTGFNPNYDQGPANSSSCLFSSSPNSGQCNSLNGWQCYNLMPTDSYGHIPPGAVPHGCYPR